jgi:hypothetical protein
MMNKFLLPGALLVLLQTSALAQDANPPSPPNYCKPCLFYSGDFGPKTMNVNGLPNEEDVLVPFSEVLVPFDVPKTQQWKASGLFTNDLSSVNLIDPAQAVWSISTGVTQGSCGTTVVSGNSHASFRPTGRSAFGFNEYTTLVKIKAAPLKPGRYWLATVPECTNTSSCTSARYFATEFSGKPVDPFGPPEPCNLSYGTTTQGKNCSLVTSNKGCNRFSAGVLGTKQAGDALDAEGK